MGRTELISRIEQLQALLVDYATGSTINDPEIYVVLRRELLAESQVKSRLPKFVTDCRSLKQFWAFIKGKFGTYPERRQFLWEQFSPLLQELERDGLPVDGAATLTLDSLGVDHVTAIWQRALERRQADPEGAITLARTLVESVCKLILDESGAEYDQDADLPKLYHAAAARLRLAPSQHSEDLFRRILGNCQAVVDGLGSLRNLHGDAHGTGKVSYKPSSRHAELAVNLAGAMSTFLVQTWQSRTDNRDTILTEEE